MFNYLYSIVENRQIKKLMKTDFHENQSKGYLKIIKKLKENISNCEKPLDKQREETEKQLEINSKYFSSTVVPTVSIISILASFITTIVTNLFKNEVALLFLFTFYIVSIGLMSIALRYNDYEKAYLKLKLKCIEELEELKKFPEIIK